MTQIGYYGSVVENITAKLQSRVGTLLKQREILHMIINSSNTLMPTRSEATNLLVAQSKLEANIPVLQEEGAKMKAEGVSFTSISKMTSFIANMELHIRNVNSIYEKYKKDSDLNSTSFFPTLSLINIITIVSFIAFAGQFIFKKKRS